MSDLADQQDKAREPQPATLVEQQLGLGSALLVIFEVAQWMCANSANIGGLWAAMTHGVTNIKEWVNHTDQEVEVWKVDGGGRQDHHRIPPRQRRNVEMWIPWADNTQQYARHHATLRVGGRPLAHLWQSGRLVRCDPQERFVDGGAGVPGAAGAGGDRRIVFDADPQGRVSFVICTIGGPASRQ